MAAWAPDLADVCGPDLRKAYTSALTTLPLGPEPETWPKSMPFSVAAFFARGLAKTLPSVLYAL